MVQEGTDEVLFSHFVEVIMERNRQEKFTFIFFPGGLKQVWQILKLKSKHMGNGCGESIDHSINFPWSNTVL